MSTVSSSQVAEACPHNASDQIQEVDITEDQGEVVDWGENLDI